MSNDVNDFQNAYNENWNKDYCYQSHDIFHIGSAICSAYQNVVFAPLFTLDNVISEKSQNSLSQFSTALKDNKKVVGIYKTNETHWIAYALELTCGSVICLYKDSYNEQRLDFLNTVSNAFPNCLSYQLDKEKTPEQRDISSSGIFALCNMEILAKSPNLHKDTCFNFFNPNPLELSIYRGTVFARKYIEGCLNKAMKDFIINKFFIKDKLHKRKLEEEAHNKIKENQVKKKRKSKDNYCYPFLVEDKDKQGVCDYSKLFAQSKEVFNGNTSLISPNNLNLNDAKIQSLCTEKDSNDKNCNSESDLKRVLIENTSTVILPNWNQKKFFVNIIKTTKFNIIIGTRKFFVNFDVLKDEQIKHAFAISHPIHNIDDGVLATKSFDGEIKEDISAQFAVTDDTTASESNSIIIQETSDFTIIVQPREVSENKNKISVNFLNPILWEKNVYVKWDQCSLSSKNASFKEGLYYPTDLVHGLLAEHCSSETGINAGHSKIQPGNNVVISNERASDFIKLGDINQFLKAWKVLGIIDDKQTGYLGIIYANDEARQLVLAHRSTNFELSLKTENLHKESGLQQDIAGIFMGNILLHQAYGYVATDAAIQLLKNHSKYTDYAFSITGHSLGAWLAEMSAYYCSRDLQYPYVKTVSFDGPGSCEMMEKLSKNETKKIDYRKLNIVSYLSAPNLVNCINKHCGKIFTTYPNITDDFPKILQNFISQKKRDALLAIYGHDLKNILTHFDPKSGTLYYDKSKTYSKVESWPSITYKSIDDTRHKQSLKDILKYFLKYFVIREQIADLVFNVYNVLEITNEKFTTLESIAQLFLDISNKEINHKQFWIAHTYLDKNSDYNALRTDSLNQFQLHYVAGYQVFQVSRKVVKIEDIEEYIGEYLVCLKTNDKYIQSMQKDLSDKVSKLKSKYDYIEFAKEIHITDDSMSIDDLKNEIQTLVYRYNLEWYLKNGYKKEQLHSNIDSDSKNDYLLSFLNDVETILQREPILIVSGMLGSGKTNLVKTYAQIKQNNITSIILDVSCASFTNSLEFQIKVWNEESKSFIFKKYNHENLTETLDMFSRVLDTNLQRVLFILEKVRNWNDVVPIRKRFELLEKNGRVKFIITTRHDFLQGTEAITYLHLIPNTISQYNLPKDTELLNLLVLLKPILKAKDSTTITNTLKTLCNNSYALVDKNGDICLNTIVQNIARENKRHSSALDFLNFASQYDPSIIDKDYISRHFQTYELKEFYTSIENILKSKNKSIQHPRHLKFLMTNILPSVVPSNKLIKLFMNFLLEEEYNQLGNKITEIIKCYDDNKTAKNKKNYISSINNEILDVVKNIHYFEKKHSSFVLKSNTTKNYIIFGPTGSGKSTIINALLGNNLKCICMGDEGQPAEIIVENVENHPVISIKSTTSQTFDVEGWTKGNATYFDCPGLQDSRGLLFEMHNAQKLTSLSDVAQKGVGIMIVVTAILINGRGRNFADFLYQLDRAFDADSVKKNVLLVITQTNNPNVDNYVQMLKNHYEELKKQGVVSRFLNLFLDKDFKSRIIFVRKVNESGIKIKPNHFEDIHNALNKLGLGSCTVNTNSISRSYKDELSKLGDVMNEYVNYKMKSLAQQINKSLLEEIETSDKVGKDLKIIIREKTSFIEIDDKNQLLEQIEKLLPGQSEDIEQVTKTLEFLKLFNSSVKAHISEWGAELRTLSRNYRIFTESIITQFLDDQLVVTGLLVSVSEIDDVIRKMNNVPQFIWIKTKIFLVDKSVVWRWKPPHTIFKNVENGTNLYLKAKKCRILGMNQTIDISGKNGVNPGDNGGNGGSFYGQFDYFFGGKLIVNVRGGNGADGDFDITNRLKTITSSIEEIRRNKDSIDTLDNICKQKRHCDMLKDLDQFKNDLLVSREKLEKLVLKIEKLEKKAALLKIQRNNNKSKEYNNIQKNKKDLEKEKHSLMRNISEIEQKVQDFENAAALSTLNKIRDKKLEISGKIDLNKKLLDKKIKDEDETDKISKNRNYVTRIQTKIQNLKAEFETANKDDDIHQLKVILSKFESILKELDGENHTLSTKVFNKEVGKPIKSIQTLQEEIKKLENKLIIQTKKCQSKKMTFYIAGERYNLSSNEIDEYKQKISTKLILLERDQKELSTQTKAFEKLIQNFREKSEQYIANQEQINHIEASFEKELERLEKSNINLNELKCHKKDIQKLYETLQEKKNELTNVLIKKDAIFIGSNEHFSEKDLKSIIGGKMLSLSKNYKSLVDNYDEEKEKLLQYKEKFESEYDNDKNVKLEKELRTLVKENICVSIEIKYLETNLALNRFKKKDAEYLEEKNKSECLGEKKDTKYLKGKKDAKHLEENLKMYQKKLEDNREKCKKICENINWIKSKPNKVATESEFDNEISLIYEKLQSYVQILSDLNINLVKRIDYAKTYAPQLVKAYKSYDEAVCCFKEKKTKYECWKKTQNNEQQALIEILDKLISHQDFLQKLFHAESEAAKVLLLQDAALVSRVRRQWSDRSSSEKFSYLVKEILCFNTQFIEKYRLVGTEGGIGGNSGTFFLNDDLRKSYPGAGGSSITLNGVYINEYSHAKFRQIKEKKELENAGTKVTDFISAIQGTVVTGTVQIAKKVAKKTGIPFFVRNFAKAANLNRASLTNYGILSSKGIFISVLIAQLLGSPLIAALSCEWVHGPYIAKKKNEDGIADNIPLNLNYLPQENLKLTNEMESAAKFIDNEKL